MRDSYEPIPKPQRIKNKQALAEDRSPYCEICARFDTIHRHHIKSRGAGGHDTQENFIDVCYECHDKIHRAIIRKEEMRKILLAREDLPASCSRCKQSFYPVWNGENYICHRCSLVVS